MQKMQAGKSSQKALAAAAPATTATSARPPQPPVERNSFQLPATTAQYADAVFANHIVEQAYVDQEFQFVVDKLAAKRKLPADTIELLARLNSGTAQRPSNLDLLYEFDLPDQERTTQIDREIQSLVAVPWIHKHVGIYEVQPTMSEAAWAQNIYSQLIGVPFMTATETLNAPLNRENWYMFRADTNWLPGVFCSSRAQAVEDLTVRDPGTGQVLVLKPDQFLSRVVTRHTQPIHDTFFLAEHKRTSTDRTDVNKLLLEGCATLLARSRYLEGYRAETVLQWVPLVYCAGRQVQMTLMWYTAHTQEFFYSSIETARGDAWFGLDSLADMFQLQHLMYNLAEAVRAQLEVASRSKYNLAQVVHFHRLTSPSKRGRDPNSRSGDGSGSSAGPHPLPSNQSGQRGSPNSKRGRGNAGAGRGDTGAGGRRWRPSGPYVAVCDEAMATLGAHTYLPWLANRAMAFWRSGADEREQLLSQVPVATLHYNASHSNETFLKLLDPAKLSACDIETEVAIHTKLANTPQARVPRILHHMTIQADGRDFTVLEIENAGDTRYVAKNFEEFLSVIQQTLQAFECIHSLGIVHCDMKPEHIAVQRSMDDSVSVSIIDWGMAVQLDSPESTFQAPSAGTAGFNAPEMRADDPACTSAVDIYSLGCTFHEFLRNKALGQHSDCEAFHELTVLLRQMCAADPRGRPSAHEALKHTFFSGLVPQAQSP